MNFGEAIIALKAGKKVARAGWNGKNMSLELQNPDAHSKMTLPYIFMNTVHGGRVPWLASQTDMLSEDWATVEPEQRAEAYVSRATAILHNTVESEAVATQRAADGDLIGKVAWLKDGYCAPKQIGRCKIIAHTISGLVTVEWLDADHYHEKGDTSMESLRNLAVPTVKQ
jgi:hypothetical protein